MRKISTSIKDYSQVKYVYLPNFISSSYAEEIELRIRYLEEKRVMCGIPNVTWAEQNVPDGHELFDIFVNDNTIDYINSIIGLEMGIRPKSIRVWTSKYIQGEYINPHKDKGGTTQLIICLKNASIENGGYIVLRPEQEINIWLSPGDAILFRASEVVHFTTPLSVTPSIPNPIRIVAVGRYYY